MARSLNFIIPAASMRGHLRKGAGECAGDEPDRRRHRGHRCVAAADTEDRGIPVRYAGPDASGNQLDLPAPALADFQATAATTLRMYPVSQTPDISLAGTFTWSEPLLGDIVNGQCPQSWNDLLFWLSIARVIDGNRGDVPVLRIVSEWDSDRRRLRMWRRQCECRLGRESRRHDNGARVRSYARFWPWTMRTGQFFH